MLTFKKAEKSQINNTMIHFQVLGKPSQTELRSHGAQKIIKMRVKMSEVENKRKLHTIHQRVDSLKKEKMPPSQINQKEESKDAS